MQATPEFVCWSLSECCPLREVLDDPHSPPAVERLLRPIRTWSDALAEDRVFEGVCVSAAVVDLNSNVEPLGFRVEEALAGYGGEEHVAKTCGDCRANATAGIAPGSLAGCHGLLEFSPQEETAESALQQALAAHPRIAEHLPAATAAWRRLWMEPAESLSQRESLQTILQTLVGQDAFFETRLASILAALAISIRYDIGFRFEHFPRGSVDGRLWRLIEHCGRCKAPWRSGSKYCRVCKRSGGSQAARTRKSRGARPYWRLAGFLGAEHVKPFLARYFAQKGM